LGITVLGLKLKDTAVPFPNAGIEEKVELVYTYTKELGEKEVATLMEQHQQANGQHEL
jgi:hypothetical protein